MLNPIERLTQDRIIRLFTEKLAMSIIRQHNSNVEQELLTGRVRLGLREN